MEVQTKVTRGRSFVEKAIEITSSSKGLAAVLRGADNPVTQIRSMDLLYTMGVDIEKPERYPFALIAAAIARVKPSADGDTPVMKALSRVYEDRSSSSPAVRRLRRLLSCTSVAECCDVLRPILKLVESKGESVCYSKLLDDLLWFNLYQDHIKARWVKDFCGPVKTGDSK